MNRSGGHSGVPCHSSEESKGQWILQHYCHTAIGIVCQSWFLESGSLLQMWSQNQRAPGNQLRSAASLFRLIWVDCGILVQSNLHKLIEDFHCVPTNQNWNIVDTIMTVIIYKWYVVTVWRIAWLPMFSAGQFRASFWELVIVSKPLILDYISAAADSQMMLQLAPVSFIQSAARPL